jgi:hypothetical protein
VVLAAAEPAFGRSCLGIRNLLQEWSALNSLRPCLTKLKQVPDDHMNDRCESRFGSASPGRFVSLNFGNSLPLGKAKPLSADGTAALCRWESRTLPE